MGSKVVWAMSNFIVFVCMAATTIISFLSVSDYSDGIQHVLGANKAIKIAALVIFSLLGFPLAVSINSHVDHLSFLPIYYSKCNHLLTFHMLQITYSVPFSVTAELTAGTGGGQGFSLIDLS